MGDAKLFRLSGSAAVIDLRTGNNATLRPGLVVLSEDAHAHAIAALEADNAKLRAELERRAVDDHTEQALAMVPVKPTQAMISAGWKVGLMGMDRDGDCTGMSLRDYFAAKAVQGMLACPALLASDQHMLARDAYVVADAMLEARSK